jgi:hypothetical protein
VSARRAAVMAYMCNLLLRSVPKPGNKVPDIIFDKPGPETAEKEEPQQPLRLFPGKNVTKPAALAFAPAGPANHGRLSPHLAYPPTGNIHCQCRLHTALPAWLEVPASRRPVGLAACG